MPRFLVAIALISLFLFFPNSALASYFYLSPDSNTVQKETTFSVDVKLNTQSDAVNGVSAYLTFPKEKLEVLSIQGNDQILPIVAEESAEDGVIKISRANLSSISGDLTIATINFKAKVLGPAQVEFTAGSAAPKTTDSSDSLDLGASIGGNYQINNSAPNRSPAPEPSGRRIISCREKETGNKVQFNSIVSSLNDLKAKFDTIFVLVDDYYKNSGQNNPSFTGQKLLLEIDRAQAVSQLEKLKADTEVFSCGLGNPRDNLNLIKRESQTTRDAFKKYQDSLKKLIQVLVAAR